MISLIGCDSNLWMCTPIVSTTIFNDHTQLTNTLKYMRHWKQLNILEE